MEQQKGIMENEEVSFKRTCYCNHTSFTTQFVLCLVLFRFKQFCKHSCVTHKHQNYIVLKACYICTYCFAILLHNIHTKIKSIKYEQNLVERRISLTNAAKRAYTNNALTDQTTNVNKFVGRSLIC